VVARAEFIGLCAIEALQVRGLLARRGSTTATQWYKFFFMKGSELPTPRFNSCVHNNGINYEVLSIKRLADLCYTITVAYTT
jgi:hypothetical protein